MWHVPKSGELIGPKNIVSRHYRSRALVILIQVEPTTIGRLWSWLLILNLPFVIAVWILEAGSLDLEITFASVSEYIRMAGCGCGITAGEIEVGNRMPKTSNAPILWSLWYTFIIEFRTELWIFLFSLSDILAIWAKEEILLCIHPRWYDLLWYDGEGRTGLHK